MTELLRVNRLWNQIWRIPDPALWLDFADAGSGVVSTTPTPCSGITSPTPTFTRATTATTVLSTGLIGSVASGSPRSYYDPTTLAYLGYLAEGARTNLCLQSEAFPTTWTNVNSTEASNAVVAPDGATTADRLIPDNLATDGAFLQTGLTLTAGSTYTFSVFAKTSVLDSIQLRMGDLSFTNSVSVTYNTTTGAVESAAAVAGTWTAASATAKQYPSGWWRFTVTATATTNAGDRVSLVCTDTGDGTNGILLWGAQVELGPFASSYIPTTTVSVTRNADVLTYPGAGWLNASAGTLLAQFQCFSPANNQRVCECQPSGDPNNRLFDLFLNGIPQPSWFGNAAGVQQFNIGAGSVAANITKNVAGCYLANSAQIAVGGVTGTEDTSVTLPTGTFVLNIGSFDGGVNQLFGPIRRVKYFNSRLSDAELQRLTGG